MCVVKSIGTFFQDTVLTDRPVTGCRYVGQQQVFDDLGQGLLDNAMQGYNAALFAYGQTGAGKSYTMTGYGPNKGIIPILCEKVGQPCPFHQSVHAASVCSLGGLASVKGLRVMADLHCLLGV